jgi:Domain of unknown function (DUF4424)
MRMILAGLVLALSSTTALANDSAAEIALGGLVLKPSDSISLDTEDLYISPTEVRVKYRFTNTTSSDVSTLVAFPLPDQKFDELGEDGYRNFSNETKFTTRVDGKPVDLTVVVQALLKDEDISDRITAAGLPVNGLTDFEAFNASVNAMTAALRDTLVADGVLVKEGEEPSPFYRPGWNVRTSVTRQQVFPAGKTISVEHHYVPLAGGSVGGGLGPDSRNGEWGEVQTRKYCIEKSWYASFDKQLAKRRTDDNPAPYSETWLGYVLKSGANWKGPIKDFRLVVDKGKADSLVSFCGNGVKKIAPTQFEIRKTNFEPKEDLNILIVNWYDPQAQ